MCIPGNYPFFGSDDSKGLPKVKRIFRRNLAEKILTDLERTGKVLISAPPFSGKTALAQLVAMVAIERGLKVIGISFAGYVVHRNACLKIRSQAEIDIFSSYIQKMIAMEWMNLVMDSNTLLIIDDAHNIYHLEVCL